MTRAKIFIHLTCLGVLLCAAGMHAQSDAVRGAMQRGVEAMRANQLAQAEGAFRQAVELAPAMADARFDLGLILAREGKLDDAIAELRRALTLDPRLPAAHQFLGIFLFNAHRSEEARKELLTELENDPDSLDTLTFLANIDLTAGRTAEAAAWLDRAYALAPKDLNILELRGRAHTQLGRESYARMAELEPDSWHVHRVQAQLYAGDGKHAAAITEYQAALKLEARNPDLFEGLGDEYRANSQLDLALAAYSQELKLAPANPLALYNVGSVQVELGNSAAGVPMLLKVVDLLPGSARAEYYLGRGLATLGRDPEAADWLQKATTDDPDGEIAKRSFFELARTDRKLHRVADAERATAGYNRIRQAQDRANSQQVERFKKSDAATGRQPEP